MNPVNLPVQSASAGPIEQEALAMQLEALRGLLLATAQALCAGDADAVQSSSAQLAAFAVSLQPVWAQRLAKPDGLALTGLLQGHRRKLRPLLEARALYLAGLRRWRRSLRLRRSLMEMQSEPSAYSNDELSRWY